MSAPILSTKLYFAPPRRNLVLRPPLVEWLAAGPRGPLTLISAPPGSGKTTLMSEWRAGVGRDAAVAWLSLDAGDEVAETLVISVSTARSYIKSLCGKLAAHCREVAIEKGRGAGLL